MSDSGIGGAVKVDEKTACVASEKQSTIARTIFFIFLFLFQSIGIFSLPNEKQRGRCCRELPETSTIWRVFCVSISSNRIGSRRFVSIFSDNVMRTFVD